MPTFNQLVRKGRQTTVKKSTAPALQKGYNSLRKKTTDLSAPQKRNTHFTITSEMRKSNNQRLAAEARVEDFVIGSNIINLIMTQVAENRELTALFEDILDEDGSEIYMKPASLYVQLGVPVNFYTVTESASRRGHIAVGYKLVRDGETEIVTNPEKSEEVVFGEADYMIVIAED